MDDPHYGEQNAEEDPPPVFGSWNRFYIFVIVMHIILISFFYWFTKIYS